MTRPITVIRFILIILYILLIITNWWEIDSLTNSYLYKIKNIVVSNDIDINYLVYQILRIITLLLIIFKIRFFLIVSFLLGIYGIFFLPTSGLTASVMDWYSLSQNNIQTNIFALCTYTIPTVSAIGLILWLSTQFKKNTTEEHQ